MIVWDVYEMDSSLSRLHHVKCRRRIRNFGIKNNFDVLSENAVDKENVVRIAVVHGQDIHSLKDYLAEEFEDIEITKIESGISNPVLSKWKINDGREVVDGKKVG